MATTAPTTTALKPHIPAVKFNSDIKGGATVKAMTAAEAKGAKGEPFMVPLANVHVYDDFNVRVTGTPSSEEAMGELVASIVANGFYPSKPLAVFVAADADANVLYIKDGHRRFEAIGRANAALTEAGKPTIDMVPVIATPAGSIEDMMIEMAQSNTGAPLTMYEKGLLAKRLLDADMTKDDIASRLSMTERHLNNVLLVADAPAKLRDLIVTDKVTPTTALKLMRDPKTAAAKATEMVKASADKGKAKAQPKDSKVKMTQTVQTVEFKAGASIKETLTAMAAFIREHVGHGEDDVISTDLGTVTVTVATPAPKPAPKAAPAKKASVSKPGKTSEGGEPSFTDALKAAAKPIPESAPAKPKAAPKAKATPKAKAAPAAAAEGLEGL